jgi:hypothetical protein
MVPFIAIKTAARKRHGRVFSSRAIHAGRAAEDILPCTARVAPLPIRTRVVAALALLAAFNVVVVELARCLVAVKVPSGTQRAVSLALIGPPPFRTNDALRLAAFVLISSRGAVFAPIPFRFGAGCLVRSIWTSGGGKRRWLQRRQRRRLQ